MAAGMPTRDTMNEIIGHFVHKEAKHRRILPTCAIDSDDGEAATDLYDSDYDSFLERLHSFNSLTWCGKPAGLTPPECARYGWKCVGADTLRCISCGAYLAGRMPMAWQTKVYNACCAKLVEALRNGHKECCPWTFNPSPESFTSVFLKGRRSTVVAFKATTEQIHSRGERTTLVSSEKIDCMGLSLSDRCRLLGDLDGVEETPSGPLEAPLALPGGETRESAAIIALCGWKVKAKSQDILHCDFCNRDLGMWNYHSPASLALPVSESEDEGDTGTSMTSSAPSSPIAQLESVGGPGDPSANGLLSTGPAFTIEVCGPSDGEAASTAVTGITDGETLASTEVCDLPDADTMDSTNVCDPADGDTMAEPKVVSDSVNGETLDSAEGCDLADGSCTPIESETAAATELCDPADSETTSTEFCGSADSEMTSTEVCGSADSEMTSTEVCGSADSEMTSTEVCGSADSEMTSTEVCGSADSEMTSTEVCGSADSEMTSTEVCGPADSEMTSTEVCGSADSEMTSTEVCGSADSETTSTEVCGPAEVSAEPVVMDTASAGHEEVNPGEGGNADYGDRTDRDINPVASQPESAVVHDVASELVEADTASTVGPVEVESAASQSSPLQPEEVKSATDSEGDKVDVTVSTMDVVSHIVDISQTDGGLSSSVLAEAVAMETDPQEACREIPERGEVSQVRVDSVPASGPTGKKLERLVLRLAEKVGSPPKEGTTDNDVDRKTVGLGELSPPGLELRSGAEVEEAVRQSVAGPPEQEDHRAEVEEAARQSVAGPPEQEDHRAEVEEAVRQSVAGPPEQEDHRAEVEETARQSVAGPPEQEDHRAEVEEAAHKSVTGPPEQEDHRAEVEETARQSVAGPPEQEDHRAEVEETARQSLAGPPEQEDRRAEVEEAVRQSVTGPPEKEDHRAEVEEAARQSVAGPPEQGDHRAEVEEAVRQSVAGPPEQGDYTGKAGSPEIGDTTVSTHTEETSLDGKGLHGNSVVAECLHGDSAVAECLHSIIEECLIADNAAYDVTLSDPLKPSEGTVHPGAPTTGPGQATETDGVVRSGKRRQDDSQESRPKRKKIKIARSYLDPVAEHHPWCAWSAGTNSTEGEAREGDWRRHLQVLLAAETPPRENRAARLARMTQPCESLRNIRQIFQDWVSPVVRSPEAKAPVASSPVTS